MKKNGKLEFYRFVFCLAILFYHMEKYLIGEPEYRGIGFGLVSHGSMGVEYFFMLSGFFLAKTALKRHSALSGVPLFSRESSSDSARFLLRKYLRIFPEHTVAFILTLIVNLFSRYTRGVLTPASSVFYLIDNFFSFFLLQMSGLLYANANQIEWYLSAMLIAMAVIYPLCRRYYYGFTRCAAPLISLLILGSLYYNTGSLTTVGAWTPLGFKGLLRAFADIMLGTSAFELSRVISEKHISAGTVTVIGHLERISFLIIIVFMLSYMPKKYEFHVAALILVLLVCACSGKSRFDRLWNSRTVGFLGEFTLSIYLAQVAAINLIGALMGSFPITAQIAACTLLTAVFAFAVRVLGRALDRRFFARLTESL